ANLGGDHVGLLGVCEEEELIELVRGDVADDAAEIFSVPEPCRARARSDPMRAEADGLDDFADRPGFDQFAGFDGGRVLETLAIHARRHAFRLAMYAPRFGQLRKRSRARLVGHKILAMPHDADAERRAFIRYRGAYDQMNGFVFENLVLAPRLFGLRELF